MNKTKIEWCDYSWNPITGCLHDCWYCYVKRLRNYNRTPHLHEDRLHQPFKIKKPSRLFVCSTADLFGEWVLEEWINEVLKVTRMADWHIYLFLTKNPHRMQQFEFGDNTWLGTTVDIEENAKRIYDLTLTLHKNLFISFEPMLSGMDIPDYMFADIKWLIFGALTGGEKRRHPVREDWIEKILSKTDKIKIPVFMKNNLKPEWAHRLRQEFPDKLKITMREK